MLIELVQMSLALILFAIGVWFYWVMQPARPRTPVRLATPLWVRWTSTVNLLIAAVMGKRRQLTSE